MYKHLFFFFSYTVYMTVGMCSGEVWNMGVLASTSLAWIAIEESLLLSHYEPLRNKASKENPNFM